MDVIDEAKRVLTIEAQSILDLSEKIDQNFSRAVELLYHCKGRVVLMGMGKSGLVGRKIASTFASTGTPAFFLHPAEGINGDFGMLTKEDVVIAISNRINGVAQMLSFRRNGYYVYLELLNVDTDQSLSVLMGFANNIDGKISNG